MPATGILPAAPPELTEPLSDQQRALRRSGGRQELLFHELSRTNLSPSPSPSPGHHTWLTLRHAEKQGSAVTVAHIPKPSAAAVTKADTARCTEAYTPSPAPCSW